MARIHYSFFLIIAAVLLVVMFIVMRDDTSILQNWMRALSIEGFSSPPVLDSPQCPPHGYKFFNDATGGSFCCKGRINPYTHRCETTDPKGLCAFRPDIPAARGGGMVPLCSKLIEDSHSQHQASCPPSLPNYAMIGKCCKHNPDLDGFDCIPSDNADSTQYCKIVGPLNGESGERLCAEVSMQDSAHCPTQIPQKIKYTTGTREAAAYGAKAAGLSVPVCFGMNDVCIPDEAVAYYQSANGLYKGKDIPKWSYSCSGWKTKNVALDQATPMDTKYL